MAYNPNPPPPDADNYEDAFTPDPVPTTPDPSLKILGANADNLVIGRNGYNVTHDTPGDNIISRNIPSALFDESDVLELASTTIYELLPRPVTYPNTPPISLDVFAANWSRIYNFGGVTDPSKDPNINQVTDWSIEDWGVRHKWPAVATLDPTYIFFTQDPALFYTQKVISHYEPDEDGRPQAVMVEDDKIVWKLNGQEVHRGWYMDLSALSRTVQVVMDQAIIVPKILSIEATNDAGTIRKEIKYAAIDSDDSALVTGGSEVDNFSSTFQGQFVADEDAASDNYRSAIFWPDPRYGPRDVYVRFHWDGFGKGRSKRRKFKKANAVLRVDGTVVSMKRATTIFDRWQNIDSTHNRHQDALAAFPDIFNDNGRVKVKYRNQGGAMLSEVNVTDWTEGRKSALFTDEQTYGNSKLFKFKKKPGPFDVSITTGFKVRKGSAGRGKWTRHWSKTISYDESQLNLDTPLQPIDLGVVHISYQHKD